MRGHDAAQGFPPRVGARQADHGAVGPPERADGVRDAARGVAAVVPRQGLPRGAGRRDHHGRAVRPELEPHDVAVGAREAREGMVEVSAAQVERVADDREWPGAGRRPPAARSSAREAGQPVEDREDGEGRP